MSHSYNLGEVRKNIAADKSRNGVVGNNGTTIPIIPNVSDIIPKNVSNAFIGAKIVQFNEKAFYVFVLFFFYELYLHQCSQGDIRYTFF